MKYTGACHCKKVNFEVETELERVISCNCSYCHIRGLLLTFIPIEKFMLLSGEDNLVSYKFNKKAIDHLFCKMCGVESFARGEDKEGKKMVAINVRCLESVDIEKLTLTKVNGKDW